MAKTIKVNFEVDENAYWNLKKIALKRRIGINELMRIILEKESKNEKTN